MKPAHLLLLAEDLPRLLAHQPEGYGDALFRRMASTAYYALFHKIIEEATTGAFRAAEFHFAIGRKFQHKVMYDVCKEFLDKPCY